MNIWIRRSLAATAVAGGLVVAGAAAATADESDSSRTSQSSYSAPVEIGGASAGVEREQSNTDQQQAGSTGDGEAAHTEESSSDSRRDAYAVQTDDARAEPTLQLSDSSDSSSESTGDGAIEKSEQHSDREADASSPVHVGGATATAEQEQNSQESSSARSADEDGTRSSSSASNESSHEQSTVGTGDVDAEPRAAVSDSRSSDSERVGGDNGIEQDESSSQTEADAEAPYSVDGAETHLVQDERSSESSTATSSDEDGTRSSRQSSQDASHTESWTHVGEAGGHPAAAFDNQQESSSERVGDDIEQSESSRSTDTDASAPTWADGAETGLVRSDSTASESQASSTDEDGARSTWQRDRSESASMLTGSTREVEATPAAAFSDRRHQEDERVGNLSDSESESSSDLDAASPAEYDGAALAGDFWSSESNSSGSMLSDEDGTRSTQDAETDTERTSPEIGFDGLAADPDAELSDEQLSDQES
jgi:hypothetical protein